ncbi:MAG: Rieske (2Fe-2S) protein [Myxococcota bacterium]|nr:Rieske (2Fe-2S) protein [Myxococcota bacterium]
MAKKSGKNEDGLEILQPTRRDAIRTTIAGGCSLALLSSAGCTFADVYGDLGYREIELDLNSSQYNALQAVGGIAEVTDGAWQLVAVRSSQTEIIALNRICPHEQLEMSPNIGAVWFDDSLICPHHGSRFDASGQPLPGSLSGQAIDSYRVEFDANANRAIVFVGEESPDNSAPS